MANNPAKKYISNYPSGLIYQERSVRTFWLSLILLCVGLSAGAQISEARRQPLVDAAHTEVWRKALKTHRPSIIGCFTAVYPSANYKEVSCGKPTTLHSIITKERPLVTENSTGDYVTTYSTALSAVQGTLLSVENVNSVTGFGNVSQEFNLQINTESSFPASGAGQICSTSKNANCTGWLQFVYDSGGSINIQSWAINYGACSSSFNLSGPQSSCGNRTAFFQLSGPLLKFSDLNGATLEGDVYADASTGQPFDRVELTVAGHNFLAVGADISGARNNWRNVQFNVYGNSGGDQSVFNSGSLVSVQVIGSHAGTTPPTCGNIGAGDTTGESTNLTLMPCKTLSSGITFKEGVAPIIATLSSSTAPAVGGEPVQLTAGTGSPNGTFVVDGFNPNVAVFFGATRAYLEGCTNTATSSSCTVQVPPGSGSVSVTAANVFNDGSLGPASAPVSFSYIGVCGPQEAALEAAQAAQQNAPFPGEIPGQTPAQYRAMILRFGAAVRAASRALTACQNANGGTAH
jgi:hypothetical protein